MIAQDLPKVYSLVVLEQRLTSSSAPRVVCLLPTILPLVQTLGRPQKEDGHQTLVKWKHWAPRFQLLDPV